MMAKRTVRKRMRKRVKSRVRRAACVIEAGWGEQNTGSRETCGGMRE